MRVSALFVKFEMTRRVNRKSLPAAFSGVNLERDLLRHRPARHETGGFETEQVGNFPLEGIYQIAGSVNVLREIIFAGVFGNERKFFARLLQDVTVNEFLALRPQICAHFESLAVYFGVSKKMVVPTGTDSFVKFLIKTPIFLTPLTV